MSEIVMPFDCGLLKKLESAFLTCCHFEFWLLQSRGFVCEVYSHIDPDLSSTTTMWSGSCSAFAFEVAQASETPPFSSPSPSPPRPPLPVPPLVPAFRSGRRLPNV